MGLPSWMPGRPGGDPDTLRRYAQMWDDLNTSLDDTERRMRPQADNVSAFWRGLAADTYHTTWTTYESVFPQLHDAISQMSGHLRDAANKIDDAQSQYDHYAEIAAGIAAAAAAATIFTLGISDIVGGFSEGGVIAAATAVIETLAAALETIGGFLADLYATIGSLVITLQLSLTPMEGMLLTGAVGAIGFGGATYLSGDHNALDILAASAFGFAGTADPAFGTAGGDGVPAAAAQELQAQIEARQALEPSNPLYLPPGTQLGDLSGYTDAQLAGTTGPDALTAMREAETGAPGAQEFADKASAKAAAAGTPQESAYNNFFKAATGKSTDFTSTQLPDGSTRVSFFSPANNAGYGKIYVQVIGPDGTVTQDFKLDIDPTTQLPRMKVTGN